MKKILSLLITICMMSLFSLSVHAQSIIGTWVTDGTFSLDEEAAYEVKKEEFCLTFKANGATTITYDYLMEVKEEDGMNILLGINVNVPGTYKKTGNNIKMDMNPKQTKVNIYKLDIHLTRELEQTLAAVGVTKQQLKNMVLNEFNAQDMSNLFVEINKINNVELNILKLTNTTLEFRDEDGDTRTFTRKQ